MKEKDRIFSLVALILVAFAPFGALADGNSSGGGGDAMAMEFTSLGQAWDILLSSLPEKDRMGIDPKTFHRTLYSALVRTQPTAEFLGEVDAFNKDGRIVINRERWSGDTSLQKTMIALHEYLGLMGLDRKYEISGPAIKTLGPQALKYANEKRDFKCTLNVYDSPTVREYCDGGTVTLSVNNIKPFFTASGIFERPEDGIPNFRTWGLKTPSGMDIIVMGSINRTSAHIGFSHTVLQLRPDEASSSGPIPADLPPESAGGDYEAEQGEVLPSAFKVTARGLILDLDMITSTTVRTEMVCRQ